MSIESDLDKIRAELPAGYAFETLTVRDGEGRVHRHFVVLPFAARWVAGNAVDRAGQHANHRWPADRLR